jgi:hypothetical protein
MSAAAEQLIKFSSSRVLLLGPLSQIILLQQSTHAVVRSALVSFGLK